MGGEEKNVVIFPPNAEQFSHFSLPWRLRNSHEGSTASEGARDDDILKAKQFAAMYRRTENVMTRQPPHFITCVHAPPRPARERIFVLCVVNTPAGYVRPSPPKQNA